MLATAKRIINGLGLRAPVLRALRAYGNSFPHKTVVRRGVKYQLDLRQVIDFATYFAGWEPETIAFIDDSVGPGDVVIEVGANVGIQTLHLARRVHPSGHVYAFEPTQFALAKLTTNLTLNPQLAQCITVKPHLVTDHALDVPRLTIKSSYSMEPGVRFDGEEVDPRSAVSLDSFVDGENLARLDLLKIDVDGYDFKVLQGAERSIRRFKPTIYIELDEHMLNRQGASVRDIHHFLSEHGYAGRFAGSDEVVSDVERLVNEVKRVGHINSVYRFQSTAEMVTKSA
jgi:FkbM family methyltransferase